MIRSLYAATLSLPTLAVSAAEMTFPPEIVLPDPEEKTWLQQEVEPLLPHITLTMSEEEVRGLVERYIEAFYQVRGIEVRPEVKRAKVEAMVDEIKRIKRIKRILPYRHSWYPK